MEIIKSKASLNKGRQIELDIARGLAVIFMVLIHVQEYFSSEYARESIVGGIIDFLGGVPAAPVFMFLMGIGVIYSRKSDPIKTIKRGIALILIGYLLNFCRGTLPNLLHWIVWKDSQFFYTGMHELIYVDIFQFSGLAMIFMGAIKKLNPSIVRVGMIALLVGGLNYLTQDIVTNNYFISALSGLFIGTNEYTFFPFLSWIFYPLAGYIFGSFLIKCQNKDKFYKLVFLGSFVVMCSTYLIFSYLLGLDIGLSSDYSYYHHQLIGNVIFTSFVLNWISLLYFVSKVLPKAIVSILERWSRNVSEIYFIHWLFIGWIVALMGYNTLALPYYFVLVFMILISSDFLSDYYVGIKKAK